MKPIDMAWGFRIHTKWFGYQSKCYPEEVYFALWLELEEEKRKNWRKYSGNPK
jgi:hypothetical protein